LSRELTADLFDPDNKWLDVDTLECRETNFCKAGQYVVEYGTDKSNYKCANCSMCPQGTWRNMQLCLPTGKNDLDASNAQECVPCGTCDGLPCMDCPLGYYKNMSACSGTTNAPGAFCVRCSTCPTMHNINTTSFCDGKGVRDTTKCIFCAEPCGPNADSYYIPSSKDGQTEVGCDGTTLALNGRSFPLFFAAFQSL
jgi:hypothetical protein